MKRLIVLFGAMVVMGISAMAEVQVLNVVQKDKFFWNMAGTSEVVWSNNKGRAKGYLLTYMNEDGEITDATMFWIFRHSGEKTYSKYNWNGALAGPYAFRGKRAVLAAFGGAMIGKLDGKGRIRNMKGTENYAGFAFNGGIDFVEYMTKFRKNGRLTRVAKKGLDPEEPSFADAEAAVEEWLMARNFEPADQ